MAVKSSRIFVLRVGHRPVRDKRITTHVCLVARAFGADGVFLDNPDPVIFSSISKVCDRWGGPFDVKYLSDPFSFVKSWKGKGGVVIHLTMYGINLPAVSDEIKSSNRDKLIIVGAEKVPKEYYLLADWNVAIGNQPHSEVSALAVLLLDLLDGWVYRSAFKDARLKIVPSKNGKEVLDLPKSKSLNSWSS